MSERQEAHKIVESVRLALAKHARPREDSTAAGGGLPRHDPFASLPEYEIYKLGQAASEITGIVSPFHRLHDTRAGARSSIGGRETVNFAAYDYLGLNGDGRIAEAVKAAMDRFGMSASASRLSGGERQIHRELDRALADLHGCEDALAFVSGHATNVSVIGTLLSGSDAI